MSTISRNCPYFGKSIRVTGATAGLIVAALLVAMVSGCERLERSPSPRFGGTFSGTSSDGQAVTVSLTQAENTVIGQVRKGERTFSLSAIVGLHGPAVLMPEDGAPEVGTITLSPAGQSMTLNWMDSPIILARGGTPLPVASGSFAGRYSAPTPHMLRLDLDQSADLLAGTGFVSGKPVAVVGRVTGENEARGLLLFSDGSQNGVKVSLSSDEQTLSLKGVGGTIEMRRK
jgi:hypothetical protein